MVSGVTCDDLAMDRYLDQGMGGDDAEQRIADLERQLADQRRIADLERQLAQAKAAAGQTDRQPPGNEAADERARRFAQAMGEALRTGEPAGAGGPSDVDMAQLREAIHRAADQAGMSHGQIDDALRNANVTYRTSHTTHSVVYPNRAGVRSHPSGKSSAAGRVGAVLGVLGGLLGICVGGAAAVIAVFPSSALWTSSLVCDSSHHLAYTTSHYSYKPGQSGTSVTFQCIGDDGGYNVNEFVIGGLQALLIALLVAVVAVAVVSVRRRRKTAGAEGYGHGPI